MEIELAHEEHRSFQEVLRLLGEVENNGKSIQQADRENFISAASYYRQRGNTKEWNSKKLCGSTKAHLILDKVHIKSIRLPYGTRFMG